MPFLDTRKQRASALILVLGVGLAVALWPYVTGLIAAPVLYVIFAPVYALLSRRLKPVLAAGITLAFALAVIVVPGGLLIGLIASEAQGMASGIVDSPLLDRVRDLRIGPYDIGGQLQQIGTRVISFLGASLLALVGTATRLALQLTIAFFGLFYLLIEPDQVWLTVRPFIPFSTENADRLKQRFKDVAASTLIGTFATAVVQGVAVGLAFAVAGLANPLFWGVVTVIVSILPVVGSGLIWGPGAIALALEHRYGWAIAMVVWGVIVVGNIDNVIRPTVFRRWARIHPFVTVIGAFAGLQYFGLLGLLIGPLAISYFFELIRMYREEYLSNGNAADPVLAPATEASPRGVAAS
ncbi:MAG TPA: AI-2E family transporter [Gemmatimonadales bacterium]|nr:AI-2E family transporter [Gemmatimonadales bacterium]